jgi:hypothetical protein
MRLDPAPAEDGSQVPDWALGALLLGAGELLSKPHVANLPDELDAMANQVAEFLPAMKQQESVRWLGMAFDYRKAGCVGGVKGLA